MENFTLVIPTFNEEEQIRNTIEGMYSNLKKLNLEPEVIIIDDSKDKTPDILTELKKEFTQMKVIHRTSSRGVGSAIRLGIQRATKENVIVFMGDAPDDTKYFPAILDKLSKGYDVVQTSRFFKGCKIVGYPKKKRIGNWLCNNFIKLVFFEFRLKDFSSLFKAFNRKKILELNLEANEFDLGLEIVLKSMKRKYKIIEVPVDWVEREEGKSKLKLSRYSKHYINRIFKVWLNK